MMNYWKAVIGAAALICGTTAFTADNQESIFKNVRVTVHSMFKGATVMGTIPAPVEYGPDVEFNPIDPGKTIVIGSFPVSLLRKVYVWDIVPDPTVPTVSTECGPIFSDVKKITIHIVGNYRPIDGGEIRCYITRD